MLEQCVSIERSSNRRSSALTAFLKMGAAIDVLVQHKPYRPWVRRSKPAG